MEHLSLKNYPFFETQRKILLQVTLLYSLCNHISQEERDSSVWQKYDSPLTNHDIVDVKVDYHREVIVEISPFF